MHARSDLRHLYSPKFFGNSPRKTLAISSAATLVILFSARMLDPAICGVITHFPIKEGVIGAWWFFLEDVLDTYQYWYNRLRVHQPLGRSLSMEALSKQYDVGVAQLLNTEKIAISRLRILWFRLGRNRSPQPRPTLSGHPWPHASSHPVLTPQRRLFHSQGFNIHQIFR